MARPADMPMGEAGPWSAILRAALLLAGLASAGLALRQLGPDVLHSVRPTVGGAAILLCGGALLTAVGLPRQLVAFAGGFAFGAFSGGLLSLAAQLFGCACAFVWARVLGRDFTRRRLRGRWRSLDGFLAAHPFSATLTLRLLPVSNNLLLNLLAGVSAIRALPFLAASLLGYMPQTAVFALLGSGVHIRHTTQIEIAVALFVVSAGLGLLVGWVAVRNPPSGAAPG